MKKIFPFLIWLWSSVLFAQNKNIYSFIPENYDTLSLTKGDLNKDGFADAVLAVFHKMEKDDLENMNVDSVPPRLLIVLFGSKSGYAEAAKSANALLCKYCGGVFGDPFNGISIEKNVLRISHYGGSAWRWSSDHLFRFQKNDFYLIGQTNYSYWNVKMCDKLDVFAGTEFKDENFLTGQFKNKKISEDCKLLENKSGKKKLQPLLSLKKFKIDS
ncbi:MAG TPA: hypothetical protein VNA26_07115 [Chitinophagaceae bacterium]|nr:hypothetical protein [Chitinophagaceae bacterium]